jgi:(p)ppGpp synthase/HD superfamily hydrolase
VQPRVAHQIATRNHAGQRNRFGDPVMDHVQRVAAVVPPDAHVTALLHDLLELCPARQQLRSKDLSDTELEAIELLTHAADESYETYVQRVAAAPGPAGRIARAVKLADLEDHLAHAAIPADAPPYAWARDQLLTARDAHRS